MKKVIALISILIAVGVVVLTYTLKDKGAEQEGSPSSQQYSRPGLLEARTSEEGEVTVVVTPQNISPDSLEWRFNVAMDTHTGELDADIQQAVMLTDDTGQAYQASSYEGMSAGGHHRSGTVIFAPMIPYPKKITLVVKDIGDVPERKFLWNLDQ